MRCRLFSQANDLFSFGPERESHHKDFPPADAVKRACVSCFVVVPRGTRSVNQFIYFFACCPAGSLSLYTFSEVKQRDRFHTRISAALSVPGGGGSAGSFPEQRLVMFCCEHKLLSLVAHASSLL